MKKFYLLIIVISFCNISYGQINTFPSNGNVGIGTITPRAKLDLDFGSSGGFLLVSNKGGNEWGVQLWDETRAVAGLSANGGTGEVRLGGFPFSYFQTIYSGGSEALRITTSGNVGIGTTTPTEKLSVNGNIRAREIKVENTNWPDYVFKKEYQLPTLQETENQIKENGHLPDIPSAAEVKNKGVDLGDMNAKLLKKIEELTLYLIEQQKQMEQLKQEQGSRITALEKALSRVTSKR